MNATNISHVIFQRSLGIWLTCAVAIVFMGGCAPPPKPNTGLYGKATHTGTLYSYRVPPVDAKNNRAPRFSQLRGSMDLAEFVDANGVLQPNLHVTEDDLITISLGSAFIKYFREGGASDSSDGGNQRKGEIVMVMSFDAGTTKRESFVVFSSGDQTLGSYLSVQDWPLLGPLKVDGSDLKVRIVMIELDQAENEKIKQLTRSVGNTAGQLQPGLAPIIKVAQPLVEAIIALNGDDVILDQRFALQRIGKASKRSELHRPPLLFGKYVLIMQEDRLKGDDVNTVAKDAADPPALSNIRFDRHSNRIYRLYDYWTDRWGWNKEIDAEGNLKSELPSDENSTETGPKVVDLGIIDNLYGCPPVKDKDGVEFDYSEHPDASRVRTEILGYDSDRTSGLERWNCLQHALSAAYCEGLRGYSASNKPKEENSGDSGVESKACDEDQLDSMGRLHLNYPVTVYPTANAVLAQYPLHTHLVLTIEESLGGIGTPIHESLISLEEFTKEQLDRVKDGEFADEIGKRLIQARIENRMQTVLLQKVRAENDQNEKLCLLFNELSKSDLSNVLNNAPLYNQAYKISGEVLTTPEEVAKYLSGNVANCTDGTTCSCADAVKVKLSKGQGSSTGKQADSDESLQLSLTEPPMTGEFVQALQDALAKQEFPINGEEGMFGQNTKQAVEQFQRANNLKVDGIVGTDTRKALGM